MALNKSKGNMYDFVSHTWNTVKGTCGHNCSYCYMKRWKNQKQVRFDEKELNTNLGNENFIFVGSSNDLFSKDITNEWIQNTIDHCSKFENRYLFQTKNPERIREFNLPINSVVCTTIETNRFLPGIMGNSPKPSLRSIGMSKIQLPKFITIEPIMKFDLDEFLLLISKCNPVQVNIGADSGNNNLPEPSIKEINKLIDELEKFTIVKQKKNLSKIIKAK